MKSEFYVKDQRCHFKALEGLNEFKITIKAHNKFIGFILAFFKKTYAVKNRDGTTFFNKGSSIKLLNSYQTKITEPALKTLLDSAIHSKEKKSIISALDGLCEWAVKQKIDKETVINFEGISAKGKYINVNQSSYEFRQAIFQETLKACEKGYKVGGKVIHIDNSQMLKETEVYGELPPLSPLQIPYNTVYRVLEEDTFNALLAQKSTYGGEPVGINMANRYGRGGGVKSGCPAQEEALCRVSNHIYALESKPYPLPEFGGIYAPHTSVFRKGEDEGFEFREAVANVSLVAVAAYDLRQGSSDCSDLGLKNMPTNSDLSNNSAYMCGMRKKIANMLRMMALKGHKDIVLGALGCGAFVNPPKIVAELFYEVLTSTEFKGRFEHVDFAILVKSDRDRENFEEFKTRFTS